MMKILIAEDEAFIANLYKLNLEQEKMSVSIAENGNQAIAMLEKSKPDLLLLDLLMPESDGFAVLEWLGKNKRKFGSMPVIVLTNLSFKLNRKKCLDLGATDYIVKSDVDIDTLVETIKKHVK